MSQAGPIDIIGTHPEIPTLFVCDVGSAVPIANTIETLGSVVAAGTHPFRSVGSGNTITYEVQIAAAIAATDATAIGLCSFDSTYFTVDANGFVTFKSGTEVNTLTGDSGVATVSAGNINVITNVASQNSGSSVLFSGTASTLTLNVTDADNNTLIGNLAGNASLGGASSNTGLGKYALASINSSSAVNNTSIGQQSLRVLTSGARNVGVGNSLRFLTTGSRNISIGVESGKSYTGAESNNILIGDSVKGTLGESNVLRIGAGTGTGNGQLQKAYISGINGVTVTTPALVSTDTSTDQLGVIPLPLSGALGGTGVANTGKTITIGGSVTFSGAYTFTGTLTGNTTVTFPTSGTLATTADIPSFPLSIANGGTNASSFTQSAGIVAYNGTSLVNYAGPQLDSSGRYTNTSQPSLISYQSSTVSNVTGDGTTYTVIFDTVTQDQNSNYNNSTGIFTCPVAGTYLVTAQVTFSALGTSNNFNSIIVLNSTPYVGTTTNANTGSNNYLSLNNIAMLKCAANDTIKVTASAANGSKNIGVVGSSAHPTRLSIVLLD